MKKTSLFFVLLTITITHSFAQKDVAAKAILSQVSQKYHSYNIVKSNFTFTIEDQQNHAQQSQDGSIIIQAKTNRFKLDIYSEGSGTTVDQEIISDGKSQWTYLKKDKEVQLNKVDNSDQAFNPAQMFTMYEKGYKYLFTGTETDKGRIYQMIDLTPEEDKEFFKVRLKIDKLKKQIYSAEIFDKNGSHYIYTIRSFMPDAGVPESIFTYDAKSHPGVEVVDLR